MYLILATGEPFVGVQCMFTLHGIAWYLDELRVLHRGRFVLFILLFVYRLICLFTSS